MQNLRANALGNFAERWLAGLGTNDLPGKWDDCTLKAGQAPIILSNTNESQGIYQYFLMIALTARKHDYA